MTGATTWHALFVDLNFAGCAWKIGKIIKETISAISFKNQTIRKLKGAKRREINWRNIYSSLKDGIIIKNSNCIAKMCLRIKWKTWLRDYIKNFK